MTQINEHILVKVEELLNEHFPIKHEGGIIFNKKLSILEKLANYLCKSTPEEMEAEIGIEYLVNKMSLRKEYKKTVIKGLIASYNNLPTHLQENIETMIQVQIRDYVYEQSRKERLNLNNTKRNILNKARTLILIEYFRSSPKYGGLGYIISKKKLKWR